MSDVASRLRSALTTRYRIERELGRGGTATIYLAYDIRHDRRVALKVIRPELTAALGPDRFLAEIRTTAALQHPNILALFDSGHVADEEGRDGDLLFYVMPWVDGESLRDRLTRQGQLPIDDALRIASAVADALAYAHHQGVVHRDIKPENILLQQGHVVVADFGIAVAMEPAVGTRLTESGMAIGTPEYMSPEQASGEQRADPRIDLYALGCVLYEMLAGEPPHRGATPQAILGRILSVDPEPLHVRRATVPAHVEAAVHTALQRLPADRFQSAAQFSAALADPTFRAAAATGVQPPGDDRRALRRSALRWIASAGALAGIGMGVWLSVQSHWTPPPVERDTVLVLPFQVIGSSELAYLGDGLVDLVAGSLEGVTGLRVLDPHTSIRVARTELERGPIDAERGRQLAVRVGANYFILGTVTGHGHRLALSARMFDARERGFPLEAPNVEGEASALFDLVYRLTGQLLVSRFGPASAPLLSRAARTSPSPDALKEFLRAEQELRAARYASAVAGLQHAVAEDSSFALAYYRLAVAANLNHSGRVAGQAIERARQLAGQLGERDHRLVDAYSAAHAGRADEAEAIYRAILEEHPDDLEAQVHLGTLLASYNPLRGRRVAEANRHLRHVSALDPAYVCPVCLMVNLALHEQDVRSADSLMIVRYGNASIPVYHAGAAAARGDTARLDEFLQRITMPAWWQASWVAAFFDRYDLAERLLVEPRGRAQLSLQQQVSASMGVVDLHVARLRWHDAVTELRRIGQIAPQRAQLRLAYLSLLPFIERPTAEVEALRQWLDGWEPERDNPSAEAVALFDYLPLARKYLLGLAHIRLGDSAAALAEAGRLEQRSAPAPGLARDLAFIIRAEVALRGNLPDRALAHLDDIRSYVPMEVINAASAGPGRGEIADLLTLEHARLLRIRILLQVGRPGDALRWIDNGFFRAGGNPLYAPELHLARAEALEAAGDRDQASEYFQRYLRIVLDADADQHAHLDRIRTRVSR